MEGYSVTEAASVLGVPTERVWELLARGVLSGAPEGQTGMRVFLQPRPAPPAAEEPATSNGDAAQRGAEVEASPFRELLTEFRNLTERYGQALLALGESRGEVASLRSRVDLLEARMDLRLPMAASMDQVSSDAGPLPMPPAAPSDHPRRSTSPPAGLDQRTDGPGSGATLSLDADVAREQEIETERAGRRRRGRGHFRDDFAEALARAQDPSPAVLPDPSDSTATVASIRYVVPARDELAEEQDSSDALLPRELPAAEPIAVLEPEIPAAITEPEQQPLAESEPEPMAAAEPEPLAESEPEPMAAAEPEPLAESEPEPMAEPEEATESEAAAEVVATVPEAPPAISAAEPVSDEPEPEAASGLDAEPPEIEDRPPGQATVAASAATELEPSTPTGEEAADEELAFDPERYSAEIDEPDWWGSDAGFSPAEPGDAGERTETSAHPLQAVSDVPETAEAVEAGEETMLRFGRRPGEDPSAEWASEDAAAEMEVASTGRHTTSETGIGDRMPGTDDLRRALAALDSPGRSRRADASVPGVTPAREPQRPAARLAPPTHQGELRSPASRAYRRLRRIFPG